MFNHCGQKFKSSDIWFLADKKSLSKEKKETMLIERVLYIGFCPRCLIDFACLVETNVADNLTYFKIKQGKKALKEIELCKTDKLYTGNDLKIKKGKPYGWTSIEGKEIHNHRGEVTKVRYYEYDKGGQRALYREFSGDSPFMCKII